MTEVRRSPDGTTTPAFGPLAVGVGDAPTAARRSLAACGTVHAVHDGLTDCLYLFLPLWQSTFGLSLAEIGLLKSAFSASMAAGQIPAASLARRVGLVTVLAFGTGLAGFGYLILGWSAGFFGLGLGLVLFGIGASVQHPLSSALISSAFTGPPLRIALGTYNFSGDVGKVLVPTLAAGIVSLWLWPAATAALGFLAVATALLIPVVLKPKRDDVATASAPGPEPMTRRDGATEWPSFSLLSAVGVIDSATRTGCLTLLPFVLSAKGADVASIGVSLSLVFAGGAAGKFACGVLAVRFGVVPTIWVTEGLTAAVILALLWTPLTPTMALLPVLGLALNGTSSVLYGSVPDLVPQAQRARAFGIFYTLGIGGGAVAPFALGVVSDNFGIDLSLISISAVVLTTLPLAWPLRNLDRTTVG
jgi:MFS family permease